MKIVFSTIIFSYFSISTFSQKSEEDRFFQVAKEPLGKQYIKFGYRKQLSYFLDHRLNERTN